MNSFSTPLSLTTAKAWLTSAAFVAGNIVLPQLIHFFPQGDLMFLPIYFFTLIGAYRYGVQVGVLTAIASPLINCLCFGMPAPQMVPLIAMKGTLLAVFAGYAAQRTGRATLLTLVAVVLGYQIVGCAIESLALGSVMAGIRDFRIGFPGILIQIFGGWWVINRLASRK